MKNRTATTLLLVILVIISSLSILNPGYALYQGQAKPMEFYLHNSNTPLNVGGVQTTYTMNTTKTFSYQTQEQAIANSFYKPIGQPKITADFYLYPQIAGPVTVDGEWQVFLWINASAYKPTGFSVQFKEITSSGQTLWDSGQMNPAITSSIGSYTDVPIYNYKLSTSLTHSFTTGSTLLVSVEVNAGSTAETRIWFDSTTYPSKVILPAKDYARANTIKTYNAEGDETSYFASNTTENNRSVTVDANITDPFGGYDVYKVNITITDPEGKRVVDNKDMTRKENSQWQTSYSNLYELKYTYSSTPTLGNYSIIITVIDNNGYNAQNEKGSYEPFIEQSQSAFTIGVIAYYNPIILITDDNNKALPGARVYVTWRNGTTDSTPLQTNQNGTIKLTNAPEGNYGFTVYYKGSIVQQNSININSNGPFTIKTRVYQLDVLILDNSQNPVNNAFVIIYQEGDGQAINLTDTTGHAYLRLPAGNYTIEAHYIGDYWLTATRTTASKQITLSQSTMEQITLTDFPPAIWTTTGFLLIITVIIIAAIAVALVYFRKRALMKTTTSK